MNRPVRNNPSAMTAKLRQALAGVADVRDPGEAEEPILAPAVRHAVVSWLAEIRSAADLDAVGIKPRSTALFYGPPGTGKTTLAHHLSARLGFPLVVVGSETIFAAHLGASERNMARLFEALDRADTPAVVLLDEIDAIGAKRGVDSGGGATHARNSTLTVMLRKIEEYSGVLIGATNLAESLDPALWRRFGMQIEVALPDEDGRFAILKRYGQPFDFGDEAIEALTELTTGSAPSLLRQLMEGVKRMLVLGARAGKLPATAEAGFSAVVQSVRPHPDYDLPPLWADPSLVRLLSSAPWPPARA
ncbi:ATP-binding protein [Chelatococcus reniformis]|uniref:AAA+ ATPase domain-containing protein n=1 Tax=Chelatococcus reniformis TaxID=1494448 RepID=A0A916UED0_9HYPH|nr:ATP-binding protein [Chelatococcus reniformis]GGC70553.1 hypothetical protein GCM10010994_31380 [Chelatococcus reniformis]